jgi:hypothetical protein
MTSSFFLRIAIRFRNYLWLFFNSSFLTGTVAGIITAVAGAVKKRICCCIICQAGLNLM